MRMPRIKKTKSSSIGTPVYHRRRRDWKDDRDLIEEVAATVNKLGGPYEYYDKGVFAFREKVKIYSKRRLPLFVWRFYSKYKIYKLIYEKIPKYINHGIKIPFKKLKNKVKKLPKIYTKINMYIKYNQFYFEKTFLK